MSDSRKPHLVRLLGAFIAVSVGLGLVGAGVMIPLVGAGGGAAKSTAQGFLSMDGEFTANPLSQQSKILSADGKVLATPYDKNRVVVPLDKISPAMQKAQLAIEDSRFYEHGGLDIRGTLRAFVTNATSGSTQGGSSITQQYVKLMLQEKALDSGNREGAQAAVAQTYSRKLQELKYALNVEKTHTKDQILASYLNLAYYGDNAYGVEAAAQHFFSKSADDLDLSEAATLAGVVQSPGRLNIRTNTDEVQTRRDVVLDRMLDLGRITGKQAEEAKSKSVKSLLDITNDSGGGTCSDAVDPYFCNYVVSYLQQMPELGPDPDARLQAINSGGLTIKTTLNRDWQKKLKDDLTDKVPFGTDKFGASGALVEPGTGDVKAVAQTSKYKIGMETASTKYSEQAWSVPAQYGGTNGFAIGSTAKMYALVAALEQGMPMEATVDAPTAGVKTPATFTRSDFEAGCTTVEPWMVSNDYTIGGEMTLGEATKKSINTAFAQLASDIGSCEIPKVMAKMGLTDGYGLPYGLAYSGGEKTKDTYAISNLVLGSDSTTPLQLATSYATLAANGKYCPPNPIKSITTANGTKMKIDPPPCKQVMDKGVAQGVTQLLTGTLESGGTADGNELAKGRPAAGKTGTTDNHRQSWFAGYTPQLSSAIWVGSPIRQYDMDGITLGGEYYKQVFGSTIAAPIWKQVMDETSKGTPKKKFTKPPKKIVKGDVREVPDVAGQGPTQAKKELEDAGFKVKEGGQVDSSVSPGAVAYTSPQGEVDKGETVTIYISTGKGEPSSTPSTEPGGSSSGG